METSFPNYRFGEFTLNITKGCVLKAGEEIKLRPKVYETKYLVEHSGRLIGKQELMQAVWPDAFVTDDSLVQCTLELRRALDDRSQQLLKTVSRRGYLFSAAVNRVAHPNDIWISPGLRSVCRHFGHYYLLNTVRQAGRRAAGEALAYINFRLLRWPPEKDGPAGFST